MLFGFIAIDVMVVLLWIKVKLSCIDKYYSKNPNHQQGFPDNSHHHHSCIQEYCGNHISHCAMPLLIFSKKVNGPEMSLDWIRSWHHWIFGRKVSRKVSRGRRLDVDQAGAGEQEELYNTSNKFGSLITKWVFLGHR